MIDIEDLAGFVAVGVVALVVVVGANAPDNHIADVVKMVEPVAELVEVVDPPVYYDPPVIRQRIDIPLSLRFKNYAGGSCTYASTGSVLAQHGKVRLARWVTRRHQGRAGVHHIAQIYDRCGIEYEITYDGDHRLLQSASDRRQSATIQYYRDHTVTFCGYETRGGKEYVVLLDNNEVGKYRWIRKALFLERWVNQFGGYAIVPMLTPNPARPYNPFNHEVKP